MTQKSKLASDANGSAIQGALHPLSTVVIAFTGTAGKNSDPIIAEIVRLISDQDCYVRFSSSGINALTSDMFLKAGQPEYFTMGGDQYISAIRLSSSGNLNVTIMV